MSILDRLGHPSMRRLQEWLEHGNSRVEEHVETCTRCATRLEPQLSEDTDRLRAALISSLVIPDGLDERLSTSIDARLASRDDLTLIGELFTVPMHTVRTLSSNEGDR